MLREFKVSNKSAERGVKLVADFLNLAKKEETFQDYLQVVETHRKDVPDIRKSTKRPRVVRIWNFVSIKFANVLKKLCIKNDQKMA